MSAAWRELDLADVGYPLARLAADGSCVISKPPETGGRVDTTTVAEQLVYEIGDPRAYLTPDVTVDFTTVQLTMLGPDEVRVTGATGRAPTDGYKVSLAYEDGFTASGMLLIYGLDCVEKARAIAEMIRTRLDRAGARRASSTSNAWARTNRSPARIRRRATYGKRCCESPWPTTTNEPSSGSPARLRR
ncbi:MAG: acyclic terpene utilization AtuA family protein [Pirellulales bacterium]